MLAVRRPANPIGWLFGASGLVWSLVIPWNPWVSHLVASGRSLPLAAQVVAVYGEFLWSTTRSGWPAWRGRWPQR